jgi:hypothetical protein
MVNGQNNKTAINQTRRYILTYIYATHFDRLSTIGVDQVKKHNIVDIQKYTHNITQ